MGIMNYACLLSPNYMWRITGSDIVTWKDSLRELDRGEGTQPSAPTTNGLVEIHHTVKTFSAGPYD